MLSCSLPMLLPIWAVIMAKAKVRVEYGTVRASQTVSPPLSRGKRDLTVA